MKENHHSGAGGLGQGAGIEDRLMVTVGCRRGVAIAARGRRNLASGHAVDLVVEHHAGDVQIAPAGVDQVIAADRQAVAVAGDDDHFKIGPRQFQTGGERQRAAVGDMEGVGVDIGTEPPRTTDAANKRQPILVDVEFIDRPQQRAQRDAVPATRAQEVRKQVLAQVLNCLFASLTLGQLLY